MLNVKGKNDLLRNCSGKRRNDNKSGGIHSNYASMCACLASAYRYMLAGGGMFQGCPLSAPVAASFGSTALLFPPRSVYYLLIITSC